MDELETVVDYFNRFQGIDSSVLSNHKDMITWTLSPFASLAQIIDATKNLDEQLLHTPFVAILWEMDQSGKMFIALSYR